MDPKFFRKYCDMIVENEVEFTLDEVAPPGKEAWIRDHKREFINRYGPERGLAILYATAWKQHNENTEVDYTSHVEPVYEKYVGFNKLEKQIAKNPKVGDPAAVAAAIGRKKYGQAAMTQKSIAGKRH